MSMEMFDVNDVLERPEHILEDALAHLRKLYQRLSDVPDDIQMMDMMRAQLPEQTRKIFDLYVEVSTEQSKEGHQSTERIESMIRQTQLDLLEALLGETYYDWTLMTPGYPLYVQAYGRSVFRKFIRSMVRENPTIEDFRRVGVAFFDGNSIKAMDVCIGYDEVARYLKAVARIFTDIHGPVRQWLDSESIKVTPMSVGGDEFALLLRSDHPLLPATMDEVVQRCKTEISTNEDLRRFINFDDRNILINFWFPTKEARRQFFSLDESSQDRELKEIRSWLPQHFEPSFSGGAVTLDEVIARRMVSLNLDKDTFNGARDMMFDMLMKVAEEHQGEDKEAYKEHVRQTDPVAYQFMLRTQNEWSLQKEIHELRKENAELKALLNHRIEE